MTETNNTTIGVITDIHGNSVALREVLDDMPPVDEIVCLGDVVGYGPNPAECVDLVREHASVTLYGNHEMFLTEPAMVGNNSEAGAGVQHALDQLSDEQLAWTQSLPYNEALYGDRILLAHGHPNPETPYKYVRKGNATKLIPHSRDHGWEFLAVGHSHVQFQLDLQQFHHDAGILFNPGSVGQPRDKDPTAAYGIINQDDRSVSLHRVEYDVERVVQQIEDAGLPRESGQRLREGQHPRTNRI